LIVGPFTAPPESQHRSPIPNQPGVLHANRQSPP
jgi:hypothetical protein